ncbi:hypothetical protein [Aliikangiella sp. IMCC44632]
MSKSYKWDFWIGNFLTPELQGGYFKEDYDPDDDDDPISKFAEDQGEVWYDHDFLEMGFKSSPTLMSDLVTGYSWCDQYEAGLKFAHLIWE